MLELLCQGSEVSCDLAHGRAVFRAGRPAGLKRANGKGERREHEEGSEQQAQDGAPGRTEGGTQVNSEQEKRHENKEGVQGS